MNVLSNQDIFCRAIQYVYIHKTHTHTIDDKIKTIAVWGKKIVVRFLVLTQRMCVIWRKKSESFWSTSFSWRSSCIRINTHAHINNISDNISAQFVKSSQFRLSIHHFCRIEGENQEKRKIFINIDFDILCFGLVCMALYTQPLQKTGICFH